MRPDIEAIRYRHNDNDVSVLIAYIAELEADLTSVATALQTVNPWCMVSHGHSTCDMAKVNTALARPGVQAVLEAQ